MLPCGIVNGRAQRLDVPGHVSYQQQRRMSAGDQECHAWLGQRTVFELVDGDMPGEMVHSVDWLVQRQCVRLGSGNTDQQRTGQTGTGSDSDGVDVSKLDSGSIKRSLDRWHHGLEMCAACDLRNDTAKTSMLVNA